MNIKYRTRTLALLIVGIGLAVTQRTPLFAAASFRGVTGSYAASSGHLGGGAVTLSSWTIEFWIRPATINAPFGLFDIHGDWKQTSISVGPGGTVGCGTMWPNTYYDTTSAPGVITENEWQLLGFVSDGLTLRIYRNGVLVANGGVSPQIFVKGEIAGSVTGVFDFGLSDLQTLPDRYFYNGALSDFRLWNRALTPAELSSHVVVQPAVTASGLLNWIPFNETAGITFTDIVAGVTGTYNNVDFVSGPMPYPGFETNGLVAYYPFNGNANDETTNGNNGTVNGAILTPDRFGVSGKAMSFNGINQFIQAPHQSYLNFPSGDFTMCYWASPNDINKYQFFMGKDMGPGNNPKWIIMYGSAAPAPPLSLGFSFHIGAPPSSGGWYAGSDTRLRSGVWQHVLVRKTSSQYDFFIDGAHVSTGPGLSTLPQNNTAPLTIGTAEGSGAMLNGKLDDIRIYGRSLSDSEVQQLYAIESGPRVDLIKAVKPSFSNLTLTTNYQMQLSGDLNNWTNHGSAFTATNTSMVYPQYFDVNNWGSQFFRLQVMP